MQMLLAVMIAGALFLGCSGERAAANPNITQKGKTMADDTQWSSLTDPAKAAQAVAVLRVRFLSADPIANKYGWDKVEVLHVIKPAAGPEFPRELSIAHHSWESGIPAGESTVYLEHFDDTGKGMWKLLMGNAAQGVSHVQAH